MRATTRALLTYYLDALNVSGDVLEVGGYTTNKSAAAAFPAPRFLYRDCDIEPGNIPNTIVADITDCRNEIPDESYDVVLSCDVFEHIDRPWRAASEISRILKPGGLVLTRTVWSWRNHPCPIDFWRFSPECLEFLFEPLECLEKGYDLSERRDDYAGFWKSGMDSVPVDGLGGFRENWAVYSMHRKGPGPAVPPFKYSDHNLARHLRLDTQGRVTNPTMLGEPAVTAAAVSVTSAAAISLGEQLARLEKIVDALSRESRPSSEHWSRFRARATSAVRRGQHARLRSPGQARV